MQGTLCFFKSSPWLGIETCGSKTSFYLNIFLSQYCAQKCDMGLSEIVILESALTTFESSIVFRKLGQ